ncbi:MAG: hypothetical protein LBV30_07110 [Propionibacteriaceae bacterium]|jgi:hypothetical protein|nr:hypothetical protein [Propionibacteriaceae bacterium]
MTRFVRFLLSTVVLTQNITRKAFTYVPLQDFTSASDIDWTQPINAHPDANGELSPDDQSIDAQLYRKYGLDPHEIAFIDSKVKAMGDD